MAENKVIWEATFDRRVKTYWLIQSVFVGAATVCLIPLLPVWWFVAKPFADRFLNSLSCVLTERSLQMKRGVFIRMEKTVPMDKITDVGLVQGPIMRLLGLEAISVETAGQSMASSITMIGIDRTREFRDAVLSQRDAYQESTRSREGSDRPAGVVAPSETEALLREIRDSLKRIERQLGGG